MGHLWKAACGIRRTHWSRPSSQLAESPSVLMVLSSNPSASASASAPCLPAWTFCTAAAIHVSIHQQSMYTSPANTPPDTAAAPEQPCSTAHSALDSSAHEVALTQYLHQNSLKMMETAMGHCFSSEAACLAPLVMGDGVTTLSLSKTSAAWNGCRAKERKQPQKRDTYLQDCDPHMGICHPCHACSSRLLILSSTSDNLDLEFCSGLRRHDKPSLKAPPSFWQFPG